MTDEQAPDAQYRFRELLDVASAAYGTNPAYCAAVLRTAGELLASSLLEVTIEAGLPPEVEAEPPAELDDEPGSERA